MATSLKHYAFAALALTGVYSAQLSVGFFSHDDAARTIAQVEIVELTLENVTEQIHKRDKELKDKAAAIKSDIANASSDMSVSELKELHQRHKQIEKDVLSDNSAFERSVEALVAAQDAEFDRFQIDEALAQLRHSYALIYGAFDFAKLEQTTDQARDREAVARDQKIQKLEGLLCEQNREVRSLRDELSAKLDELRELVSTQQPATQAPNFFSPFQFPFFQSPFQMSAMGPMGSMGSMGQGMNSWMSPFSFMLGADSGYTQNNFYGQTSFNAFSMPAVRPEMFQQQAREPSQVEAPLQGMNFIPSVERSNGLQESFSL